MPCFIIFLSASLNTLPILLWHKANTGGASMCYLVAGFVNKKAYTNLFIDIWQSYVPYEKYKPSFMSIKNTIEETLPLDEIVSFRFTANPHCDCGTSLGGFGGKKVTDKLNGYLSLLRKF